MGVFRTLVASSVVSTGSALFFRREPGSEPAFPTAEVLDTPLGVADDPSDAMDSSHLVECTDDSIPVSAKQLFSSMMGCNRAGPGSDIAALCAPYGKGGCDNEICHGMCNKMYHSSNSYQSCKCVAWGEHSKFKEFSGGAPCPLKIQPRCYLGSLWRSECEALAKNEGISAADLTVAPQSAWPEGELSIAVKENDPACQ